MLGTTLGRYRIDAKLGQGGMGVVWRAHDPRLGRDVALKVLPDALIADPPARARLLREARAAAALNHSHILTVYDVGEAGGHVYLATEYVRGRPLSEVIGSAGVSVSEAVRLGVQIAAALAHAHQHGVVHRDVKPSNVLVTPSGDAKVLDFGIATRVVSEDSPTVSFEFTDSDALVGTPVAMAPELWRGTRADTRSDVWAFGALMYTMLTGAPPFRGRTAFELSTAICTTDAPSLPDSVPPALRGLVARCLEREPERRYRSATEVHAALEAIAAGTGSGSIEVAATPRSVAVRRTPHSWVLIGAGVALAVGARLALLWWRGHAVGSARRPITSLAVLPLDNFSHTVDQQYFADGMTDALITSLAQLGVVRVISRTSVMRFRGTTLPLPEISRQLGVDAIVEGAVEQAGGRVRITAQLVRAASDEHLWAQSYEREAGDALALQDEVAGAIARELRGTLTSDSGDRSAGPRRPPAASTLPGSTSRAEVVQAYLRGRDEYQQWTRERALLALNYFDHALTLDSTFAAAMASRAAALLFLSNTPDTVALARAAIAKALALAPNLGEAHAARATLLYETDWSWAESEREFHRAIELNPSDADAHHQYSHLLAALGRVPEAREQARIMSSLDPLAPASSNHMGWLEGELGNFDRAVTENRRAMELDPGYVAGPLQLAYTAVGARRWNELRQALEDAKRLGAGVDPLKLQLVTAAEQGRRDEGARLLREMGGPTDPHLTGWVELAAWYDFFGMRNEAFAQLDSAFAHRDYDLLFANLDPGLAQLRSDPRYADLRSRMKLPR